MSLIDGGAKSREMRGKAFVVSTERSTGVTVPDIIVNGPAADEGMPLNWPCGGIVSGYGTGGTVWDGGALYSCGGGG